MAAASPTSDHRPILSIGRDPATDDRVTASRRELKFAFPGADVEKLLTILELNARPIAFGSAPVSHVSSLYFDDDRLSSARESLAGVSRRFKLRLRWYDQALPDERAFFEVKRRSGAVLEKERVAIALGAPLDTLDRLELVDRLAEILPESHAALLHLRPEPTTIVSYRRRHFRDVESSVRLTVDWKIEGFDQRGGLRIGRRFAAPLHDLAVIEAKALIVDEKHIARLLYPLKPRVSRSSKYVQCCFQHGWGILTD